MHSLRRKYPGCQTELFIYFWGPPQPATRVSRALRTRSAPGSVPPKWGCPRSVPRGVCGVFGASKSSLTLRGHSRALFGHSGAPRHPMGHSLRHPRFWGTLPGVSRCPRDSCSRQGGLHNAGGGAFSPKRTYCKQGQSAICQRPVCSSPANKQHCSAMCTFGRLKFI